jgi:hypothetical protein
LPWRKYIAVTHRTAQKEILFSQERILKLLHAILSRLKGTSDLEQVITVSLKDAYMQPVPELETGERDVLDNRLLLRKYLQDFETYSHETDF